MGHGSLTVSSIYTHRVSAADRAAAEHMDGSSMSRSATSTDDRQADNASSTSLSARLLPPPRYTSW
jgi:hypothetical protein